MIRSCKRFCDCIPEWFVSMTTPSGETGITLTRCTDCVLHLLGTPSVQSNGRTVHLKKIED